MELQLAFCLVPGEFLDAQASVDIVVLRPRLSIQIHMGQFPPRLAENLFVREILVVRLEFKFWLVLGPGLADLALSAGLRHRLQRGRLQRAILVDIFSQVQREHHDEVHLRGGAVAEDVSELV